MAAFYKAVFRKFVKKQTRPFQLTIEDEIDRIKNNPSIGEIKKTDRNRKADSGNNNSLSAFFV